MQNKKTVLLSIGIILITSLLVWTLTRQFIIDYLKLDGTTNLADTVNGLTAPIIGLLGAVLVYISFREQVKANTLQFKTINEQRDLELLYRFYEELKNDLQRIHSEYGQKYSQPSILDSLINYVDSDRQKGSPYPEFSTFLVYIFNQFIFISKRIQRNKSLSDEEIVYLIDKLKYLYDLYFAEHYLKITQKIYDSEFSTGFKKSIGEVHNSIAELNKIHGKRKDTLRQKSRK
jgi:hypothetical protein